ncbi:MAG: DUF882 domain-containing protein, partial [Rhodobacteraceae bacterium]|nr:DUF882 domain-containing protein [Paracoccaceae bacterium]
MGEPLFAGRGSLVQGATYRFRNPGQQTISSAAQQALDRIAASLAGQLDSFEVSSGYRDPAHNAAVGGARRSQHMLGNAVDVPLSGFDEARQQALVRSGLADPSVRGFGYYPGSNSIHFDVREGSPAYWGPDFTNASWRAPPWMDEMVRGWAGGAPPPTGPVPLERRTLVAYAGLDAPDDPMAFTGEVAGTPPALGAANALATGTPIPSGADRAQAPSDGVPMFGGRGIRVADMDVGTPAATDAPEPSGEPMFGGRGKLVGAPPGVTTPALTEDYRQWAAANRPELGMIDPSMRPTPEPIEQTFWGNVGEFFKGIPGGAVGMGGLMLQGLGTPEAALRGLPVFETILTYDDDIKRIPEMSDEEFGDLLGRVSQEQGGQLFGAGGTIVPLMQDIRRGDMTLDEYEAYKGEHASASDMGFYQLGQAAQEWGESLFPAGEGYEESIGRQLGGGIGSVAAGLAGMFLNPGVSTALFTLAGSGEAIQRAIDSGMATDSQAIMAGLAGLGPGATDMIPVEVLFRTMKVPPQVANPILAYIGRVGLASFTQALTEGGQEGAQQFLQNLIAQQTYDPNQPLGEGVPESMALGAGVGAIAGGAGAAITPAPARRPDVEDEDREEAPAAAPESVPEGAVPAETLFPEPAAPLAPDQPSAEPAADIIAQMKDLGDPENQRQAVWVPAATLDHLDRTGGADFLSVTGVPVPDFDGQGGILIARDQETADTATALRDQGVDAQQIIGVLTGSGTGKPLDGAFVVRQYDENGAITRERLVSTPEEVTAAEAEFAAPGRTVTVWDVPGALEDRAQRVLEEEAGAAPPAPAVPGAPLPAPPAAGTPAPETPASGAPSPVPAPIAVPTEERDALRQAGWSDADIDAMDPAARAYELDLARQGGIEVAAPVAPVPRPRPAQTPSSAPEAPSRGAADPSRRPVAAATPSPEPAAALDARLSALRDERAAARRAGAADKGLANALRVATAKAVPTVEQARPVIEWAIQNRRPDIADALLARMEATAAPDIAAPLRALRETLALSMPQQGVQPLGTQPQQGQPRPVRSDLLAPAAGGLLGGGALSPGVGTNGAADRGYPVGAPSRAAGGAVGGDIAAPPVEAAPRRYGAARKEGGRPLTLREFVASIGGVSDEKGELAALGLSHRTMTRFGPVVRKGGKQADMIREAVAEAGYFSEKYGSSYAATGKSTPDDLYQMLAENRPVYSVRDMGEVLERQETETAAREAERSAERLSDAR